jgi:hypothetical protein
VSRSRTHTRAGLAVALACVVAACGSSSSPTVKQPAGARAGHFSDPTRIDNRWLPLAPGTQYVLQGSWNRGAGRHAHRVVFTVTDLTKVVDGVRTRVLWDRDYSGRQLQEGELTFHAQDDAGNVWNFGEYPEEYEAGKLTGAPDTWVAGVARARAGILMRADPRAGTPSYRQGWAPKIEFGDKAKVFQTGARSCVPVGCYRNVLVIDETNPFEPSDGHQRKYYASGVGNIRAAPAGGEEREVLVLMRVVHLGAEAMAKARAAALKLDKRAYSVSKGVYGHTQPIEDGRS